MSMLCARVSLAVLAVSLVACSGDGPPSASQDSGIVLTDRTRIPEDDPAFESVDVNADTLVFHFNGQPTTALQSGDFVVGATGAGYLRRIESVTVRSDGAIEATTTQAVLTDVIAEGTFRVQVSGATNWEQGTSTSPLTASYDFSGLELASDPNGSITVTNGAIAFSPDFDLEVDIGKWLGITDVRAVATGELALDIDIAATASATYAYDGEVPVGPPFSVPFAFAIGPLPVKGAVVVSFNAGVSASATAAGTVATGLDATTSVQAGVECSDGCDAGSWQQLWDPSVSGNGHPPVWGINGDVTLRAYVRPEVQLVLYGAGGPYFDVTPYGEFDAAVIPAPSSWELRAGIAGHAGVEVGVRVLTREIGFAYEAELFDWNTVLASG